MPALALAAIAPGRHRTSSSCTGRPSASATPGDLKLAALAMTEPERRQRHPLNPAHPCSQATATTGCIDGQKILIGNGGIADVHVVMATVDPEARSPRPGACSSCPSGTPGPDACCASSTSSAAAPHTPGRSSSRTAACRATSCSAARSGSKRIAKGREAEKSTPPPVTPAEEGGPTAAVQRRSSAALGAFEQHAAHGGRPGARDRAGRARVRPRLRVRARGLRRADHREPGHLVPARGPGDRDRRRRLLTWRAAWMAAQRHALRARRGLDVEAEGVRGRGAHLRAGGPDPAAAGATSSDLPVEKWYRDAKLYTIFEGTSEIQRLVIGRALRARADTDPLDQRMDSPR